MICGADAESGWIKGFVPAPDSQKLALCKAHDTPENREKVVHEWYKLMLGKHQAVVRIETQRKHGAAPDLNSPSQNQNRLLTVRFLVGGSVSIPCIKHETTPHGTLEVTSLGGSLQNFPLQHIRSYELSQMVAPEVNFGPAPKILQKQDKKMSVAKNIANELASNPIAHNQAAHSSELESQEAGLAELIVDPQPQDAVVETRLQKVSRLAAKLKL